MKFYEVARFVLELDPETVAAAAATVTVTDKQTNE
jgi:hypothetical protein